MRRLEKHSSDTEVQPIENLYDKEITRYRRQEF